MPWMHAARDLLIVAATLALWRQDAALRGAGGGIAVATAVATGIMTAVCGFVVHEWGHFLGALSSRSDVRIPSTPLSLFLFQFDPETLAWCEENLVGGWEHFDLGPWHRCYLRLGNQSP